ncbi:bifunctional metallophosphatase/5'-nucleotidase [Halobiforma lacisalsi AJ5]|uniref:5'-Nucleotidase domain-containing protein n=1 Tax=Natronobacterium lacisalsi AJ5 TaxID=358396 RepID=M0LEQ7_NATLA|nr:bifunctional UDP-sugar hydrolase/5'-nucleotidase [Halobiforma lacisalsi]APW96651.1 bifunctional metallophosphatase/5'-nucleotidase [Halobiforma lacisalsi AJ5]EMA32067.1 5'-Nucleotidase domain-containing protein [Halobiforma lacisalsi AJ5]
MYAVEADGDLRPKRPDEIDRECGCGCAHTRREFMVGVTAAGIAGVGLASGTGTVGASDSALEGASDDTVTIVHDLHSHSEIGEPDGPNIARYRRVVQEQLGDRDDALFLANGDELGSSTISFFTEGAHKVEFMNDMDLAAAGVGNHDFDYGVDVAEQRFRDSEFPWLNSALYTDEGDLLPGTQRYTTFEVGDLTVGVFNVVLRGFHGITDYPDEYEQRDPVETAREMTTLLRDREDADVVVCSSHTPHETHFELAEKVDGLDAIFGSHSHYTMDAAEIHEGTVISEIGYAYFHLGVMTLDENGDLVSWERIDLDGGVDPDPEFQRRIEAQYEELEDELERSVGETAVELDTSGSVTYGREARIGNLITDVMLDAHDDAEVAFQNGGGIRTNTTYGPGELTAGDVLSILPFGNEIVVFEATGSEIERVLENRIGVLPDNAFGAQQGQQVAGLQYEWTGHEEPEIGDVYVDGDPLEPDETYVVSTTDYLKDIAGAYEPFRDAPVIWESGTALGPAVMEYLEEHSPVEPKLEDRILRVDEDLGTQGAVSRRRGETRLRFDVPEGASDVADASAFVGLARGDDVTDGEFDLDPTSVEVDGDDLWIGYDTGALQRFVARTDLEEIRVFGAFDPDPEHYGYTDPDGSLLELPVAAAYDRFRLKATVDISSPSLRPN